MTALENLIGLLTVEPVGEGRLIGQPDPGLGWDAVYGGHLLGQATAAAHHGLAPDRLVHSLHGYFLRAGKAGEPIEYDVAVVRDGRSFSTRRVTAHQGHGAIFELTASFSVPEDGP